jgi:glycosyltransferase involved in cell wall biosynthesis
VPPGDTAAMSAALARLIGDDGALATARAGAERARDELTWEASASAHLDLYREIA